MPRSSSALTTLRRRTGRIVLAGVALLGLATATGAGAAAADTAELGAGITERTPPPAPAPSTDIPGDRPVIFVGVTGVHWGDVHTLSTPALWDLSRVGAVGTVAARSVDATACPADGWLAVSAGARAADLDGVDGSCRALRDTAPTDRVAGWSDYQEAVAAQPYGSMLGLLGETLADSDVTVTGVGPGAAVALADRAGAPVGEQVRRPGTPDELTSVVGEALRGSDLVVVDAGTVRDPGNQTRGRTESDQDATEAEPDGGDTLQEESDQGPSGIDAIVEPTRAEQVARVDQRIAAVLRANRGIDATVIVVSLADSGRATLQLAVATGPAPGGGVYERNVLTSGSTRQVGLVQTTDVTSTLLTALDLEIPDASIGAPITATAGPGSATERVQLMDDITDEASQVTRVSGSYLTRLVLTQAVLFAVAAVLLTRRGRPDRRPLGTGLRVLEVGALALGAAPVASFMTGLVPWWRAASPVWGFWLVLLAWMAAITVLALAGPWRRSLLGPAGVVAGVTVGVLVLDAMSGSPLVIDSPMGAHRIMAARFYGMSNQAFALVAAAGPLLATALAQPLLARGRRGLATAAVVAVGLVLIVVNGAPGLGSDFGGPPALILGFAVLALVVSGRRVRWRTLLLVGLVAGVVVTGFAVLDWMRPPGDRTHLGRFFATVLDGGLWEVLQRKMGVHLRVLTLWRYLVLAIGGILLTALLLIGPRRSGGRLLSGPNPLSGLRKAVPLLSTCMASLGLALGVGFLINDSGIVIPATGIAVAVPCLVAAAAKHRLRTGAEDPEAGPGDTEPADPLTAGPSAG